MKVIHWENISFGGKEGGEDSYLFILNGLEWSLEMAKDWMEKDRGGKKYFSSSLSPFFKIFVLKESLNR